MEDKNTKKFHYPDCGSVKQMSEHNKDYMNCTRDDAIARGYVSCKTCRHPRTFKCKYDKSLYNRKRRNTQTTNAQA